MFCINCGNPMPDGSKFCTHCGALMAAASAPAPVPEPAPVPVPEPAPAPASRKPGRRLIITAEDNANAHTGTGVFTAAASDLGNTTSAPEVKADVIPAVETTPVPTPPVPEVPPAVPVYREPVPVEPVAPAPAYAAPAVPAYTPPVKQEYAPPAPEKIKKATTAEKRAAVKTEKKKKKSVLPVILIVLVLLAGAAAAAWFFLLSPKTVYLLESYEFVSPNHEWEEAYEFDENGLLLSMEWEGAKFDYEYEDGLIVAATIENGGVEYELEYIYEDDVLVEVAGEGDNGAEVAATCDEDGRIEEIVITNGESEMTYTYTYDDEGNIEEQVYTFGDEKNVYTYEDGLQVEFVAYYGDEKTWRSVYEYDEMGNMIKSVSYDEDGEVYQQQEIEYTYDDEDRIVSYAEHIEYPDGTEQDLSYEVEWEDDTLAQVTFEGDSYISYMEWEYDEHGNLIHETRFDEDGEIIEEITWTYVEVKIPRNAEEHDFRNPIWFVGIL